MINKIIRALVDHGPLTGNELLRAIGDVDKFELWRACFRYNTLQISSFARYYLRYDLKIDDYLRLSPSIIRDFLTYTLIALPHQRGELHRRQLILCNQHRDISVAKLRIVTELFAEINDRVTPQTKAATCAFVAGDIAYFMGHSEDRPSPATGEMMRGSDIDIVIVHTDDARADDIALIDRHLYARKPILMKHPDYRQELDYIIKPLDRVSAQAAYESIQDKIACKIIYESVFMWGSPRVYVDVRAAIERQAIHDRIQADFASAIEDRARAVDEILSSPTVSPETKALFYASQERVEFT